MARGGKRNLDTALLQLLACGATAEAAARQTGMSVRTIYRRLEDPAFNEQLKSLRAAMVQRTAGALTAASMEGVKTLIVLQQAGMPPAVRLGAARSIIELGVKIRESGDLEERFAALEAQFNAANG